MLTCLKTIFLGVLMALAVAPWTAKSAQLSDISIERLGNKLIVHIAVDGSVIPVLKYDDEARVMTVTLKGADYTDLEFEQSALSANDRKWLDSISLADSEKGAVVRFGLGPSANPLDFIVNSGFDEVQAVIYTDGTTGVATPESIAEISPSEKIKERDFSSGNPLTEVPASDMAPADDSPAEEPLPAAVMSPSEAELSPSVPSFVVDAGLPSAPLMLDSQSSGNIYEELFGSGGSQGNMDGFRGGGNGSQRIKLEVDQMPLAQVIALLVSSTDYNVIISDAVSGKSISALSLRNITLFEALDLITKSNGLSYVVEHNTIVIGAKDTLEESFGRLITKTFWLDYADGANVALLLTEMGLAREKQIQVYNGEIEYLKVNGATALSTGTEVEGIALSKNIKPIQSLISTARRNMLVVTETEERMVRIAQVIADLDKKPKQVRLETEILEITESGSRKLGLELLGEANQITTTFGEAVPPDSLVAGQVESFKLQTIVRDPISFQVALNHLVEDGDGRVLAKPNMAAIDGNQAIYFAGREVPYISSPAQSQGSTFTPATVEFKTVGITLNFKPRVDRDGEVTMEVNPQVSTLLGFIDIGEGAVAPDTLTRQATTTVRIKSGDTFILGGMISENERESFKRVPLLSKIPLFGELFQTKTWTREKTEIIVIVRPVIEE
ncbi:MAG: secretin and TonB N-terminal domain-containing protein [bacterium]|jgi:type IV pilus assembly protein PilQ